MTSLSSVTRKFWDDYPENEIPSIMLANYKGVWYYVISDSQSIFSIFRKIVRNGKDTGIVYVCDSKRCNKELTSDGDEYWHITGLRSLNAITYSTPNANYLHSNIIFDRLLSVM